METSWKKLFAIVGQITTGSIDIIIIIIIIMMSICRKRAVIRPIKYQPKMQVKNGKLITGFN